MTYTVTLSPKARDQLIALNAYIAEAASPQIADRYTDAIAEFCFSLATFPERGTRRDDIRSGVRVTNYRKRAVIAFAVDTRTKQVSILGVFYGGQDYASALPDVIDDGGT
ncbi:type II toxin-antitoxin system RelE/ParE family toxin [Metallibacterium scheffleri]|uniref:Plasmid stabilization protein n=1 Tax=Metallibacterium scheffleri TaxID=993689 RepID=A0A4S3KMI3_9GAMM|nr:type II toxin-antitoxin system RelE/ParE family toxin [Metallibacterium scheffleri]THD10135.1 plasmid stabilization protein [Metallibacterium scheffleri]